MVIPNNLDLGAISDDLVKSLLCMVVSLAKEKDSAGSFDTCFDTLLKANNLPSFNLGGVGVPNSLDLSNLLDFVGNFSQLKKVTKSTNQTTVPLDSPELATDLEVCDNRSSAPIKEKSSNLKLPPSIKIIKKKSSPKVTSSNLAEMLKLGNICFETDSNMTQQQCLEFLIGDLLKPV